MAALLARLSALPSTASLPPSGAPSFAGEMAAVAAPHFPHPTHAGTHALSDVVVGPGWAALVAPARRREAARACRPTVCMYSLMSMMNFVRAKEHYSQQI